MIGSTLVSFAYLVFAVAFYARLVAADFHYGIEQCSEAGGGFYNSGMFLPVHLSNCLDADKYYNVESNIPADSKKPNAILCNHNVTIDIKKLKWTSHDGNGKNKRSGRCWKLGPKGISLNTTCTPFESSCSYNDRIACSSSICKGKKPTS